MALQTTGAISMANIASAFGGAAPHALSEYHGADVGVPGSGQISMSHFYGKSGVTQPSATSPANLATGIGETPTLQSSAFDSFNSDSHASSQWQASTNSAFTAIVYDSGEVT